MLAAFGVDTLDPRTSLRRVWVLLQRLPPAARMGGEAWSVEAELLAGLIDHVAHLTWVTLRAAGAKNVSRPRPLPRPPRPGRAPAASAGAPLPADGERKMANWSDAGAVLAGMPGVVTHHG